MQLVMIHGRAKQGHDAFSLKQEWIASLKAGLGKSNLDLPIPESDIRFPYYGQTLFDLHKGVSDKEVADIIIRGQNASASEEQFLLEVFREVLVEAVERRGADGLDSATLEEISGANTIERGWPNWSWIRKGLQWLDSSTKGFSSTVFALALKDVHDYFNNRAFEKMILEGVAKAIHPGEETVVVSHSLGSIVAYSMFQNKDIRQGWKVPLFVTLGSPLGLTAIREHLRPLRYPNPVVGHWFNALDPKDLVALYPLNDTRFPVTPAIENYAEVDNRTQNRHGIIGYLDDAMVARRIYKALVKEAPVE